MRHDPLLDLLATTDLLGRCSADELRTVLRTADIVRVPAGTVLARPDDRPNPLLLVLEGEADAIDDGGVRTLEDGTLHGAAETLARQPRHDHVVAATAATVLVLDPRRLPPLLEDCPRLALALLRRLALDTCAA